MSNELPALRPLVHTNSLAPLEYLQNQKKRGSISTSPSLHAANFPRQSLSSLTSAPVTSSYPRPSPTFQFPARDAPTDRDLSPITSSEHSSAPGSASDATTHTIPAAQASSSMFSPHPLPGAHVNTDQPYSSITEHNHDELSDFTHRRPFSPSAHLPPHLRNAHSSSSSPSLYTMPPPLIHTNLKRKMSHDRAAATGFISSNQSPYSASPSGDDFHHPTFVPPMPLPEEDGDAPPSKRRSSVFDTRISQLSLYDRRGSLDSRATTTSSSSEWARRNSTTSVYSNLSAGAPSSISTALSSDSRLYWSPKRDAQGQQASLGGSSDTQMHYDDVPSHQHRRHHSLQRSYTNTLPVPTLPSVSFPTAPSPTSPDFPATNTNNFNRRLSVSDVTISKNSRDKPPVIHHSSYNASRAPPSPPPSGIAHSRRRSSGTEEMLANSREMDRDRHSGGSFSGASARSNSPGPSQSQYAGQGQFAESSTGAPAMAMTSSAGGQGQGAGVTPYSRSPELRVSHKMAERKRRKEMKELFDELRDQLPTDRGMKASKWEILTKAIDYIGHLKTAYDGAQTEIEGLRRMAAERGFDYPIHSHAHIPPHPHSRGPVVPSQGQPGPSLSSSSSSLALPLPRAGDVARGRGVHPESDSFESDSTGGGGGGGGAGGNRSGRSAGHHHHQQVIY